MTMQAMAMGSTRDEHVTLARIDAAIEFTSLLVRALAYAGMATLASHYDCGCAILTGLFVGDVAATIVGLFTGPRHRLMQACAELGLLLIVWFLANGDMTWPADPATRAIIGLAAFGVFAGRAGGGLMTRIGADDGWH